MWPFSAAETGCARVPDRVVRVGGLVLATAVLLAPFGSGAARAAAPPDTGRVVGGVRVTDDGIEIFEPGRAPAAGPARRTHAHDDTDADDVRISLGSRDLVRVNGPIVVDSDENGLVRVFADAEVPAGRSIDGDVVAVFGNARVDGEVSGSVVSVLGSVSLGRGATVSGDAVAVGGRLDLEPGATVHGESVTVGFMPVAWGMPTLQFLLLTIASAIAMTLLVGALLFLILDRRMRRTAITVTHRTGSSLLIGLVSPPLVIISIGLLCITVIGIPGAALLPLLYGILLFAGHVVASYVLGCKLTGRETGQGGAMLPLLVGSVFVAMFFVVGTFMAIQPGWTRSAALFFSCAGVLLVMVLAIVGSGAILVSRFGTRPEDPPPGDAAPAPTAPSGPAAAPLSSSVS